MNRGNIKVSIKNGVDDTSINTTILEDWIRMADNAVQTWKPKDSNLITFDWWDFLKDIKTYTITTSTTRLTLPDNYRAFIELTIADDKTPYKVIDYRDRKKYNDHACYIMGKYLYLIGTPAAGTGELAFVRFTDEFSSDNDEPEIESIYQDSYIEYGKKMYYNQQGDTELENKAEANFERIMLNKLRDQELARMQTYQDTAEVPASYLV